jgi:hypothetical protein
MDVAPLSFKMLNFGALTPFGEYRVDERSLLIVLDSISRAQMEIHPCFSRKSVVTGTGSGRSKPQTRETAKLR